ncbi:transcriptional regulator CecR [Edwardsiella piscicida]|uniref:transcriptional regulator CecR n=1 Tax=Edwardsiella piscicida TaxID=1263550 RepID=UPI0009BB5619|nr:transcriptional regulator CecR [Edwardsiella piscicida]ARD19416.1 transcriptional regulator [Edwardsiella piscicida]WLJ45601.1 transcriptional regulator CecR [Edwardsiella piscicida]
MKTPRANEALASATPRGEQARQALIDAGLTLFAQRGLEGATTRDIALAAGQNIAAITYYFHSKQGLYLAVAQWIADTLNASFHPLRTECERFLSRSDATPQAYLALIQRAIAHLCHLMTQPQTLHLSQIISREQMLPSAASPILHDQFISPLHTHALLGQVLAFRMARETILNRTGWPQIGPAQAQAIHEVVQLHTELLMNGLRQRGAVGNVRKTS